jgi:hypothetical protein
MLLACMRCFADLDMAALLLLLHPGAPGPCRPYDVAFAMQQLQVQLLVRG